MNKSDLKVTARRCTRRVSLIQFFSKCFERNIFKQFNEPSPGDGVILRWILEPVVEYLVAALVRIMTGLCPPHL